MNKESRPLASLGVTSASLGVTSASLGVTNKYLAFAALGAREARAEKGELLGRVVFFVMILGVFSAVYRGVAAAGASVATDPETAVWYIAITEWVVFSAPIVMLQMEEDIRRGDVAYQIARPASWIGARFAHGLGMLTVRAPVMLAIAFGTAWLFAGKPEHPAALAIGVALGLVAAAVMTLFHVAIGVAAFWLGDIAPAYWIWQKLLFVLGGLLLPLTFYPDAFVFVARLTPFPALLAGPASLATGAPLMGTGVLALTLAFWAVTGWIAANTMFSRAVRQLHVDGG
jgi:ABC-2 type transport system permease protein